MDQEGIYHSRQRRNELPPFYYHAHFVEMLAFVSEHYEPVLDEAQRAFLRDFALLSFPAQCLYVRLVNRRGVLFSRGKLRYPDIASTHDALAELDAARFLERPRIEHVDKTLTLLTKPQLMNALKPHLCGLKSNLKKADLVAIAREKASTRELYDWLPTDGLVVQGRSDAVSFFLFLFFGRIQESLSQFTQRDLGLVRAQDTDEGYDPRFDDRDDAQAAYFFARSLHDLKHDEVSALALSETLDHWPTPLSPRVADRRDQLALTLGKALEYDPTLALRVYGAGASADCSERTVRLYLSTGQKEAAQRHLEDCIASPRSDEEALWASDLYERKFGKKRTTVLTDNLRAAEVIDLDEAYRGAPERAAADWFAARGQRAFRTENRLWRTFFGLLFWDLLYGSDGSRTHCPFDRLPATLAEGRFASDYRSEIADRFLLLNDPGALKKHLLRICVQYFGTANGIFRWRQGILDAVYALIDVAPAKGMQKMLNPFCEDYRSARTGYPDLMVIDEDGVRFVEIKTDGDQLRRHQLLRLEQLRQAGFRADVVRVRWTLNPEQAYVVVDVETTGGRGAQHRVTEIGAVKVIDGQLVDEFSTLLNPQRTIPTGITRLTGITPAMVADAPVFADVADEFARFLEGGIFVAHNVGFDYRFIGSEFERLGRPFHMPKLCTCASMRKLYPGHKSYSLASLTQAYDIPLKNHHRALCDAEAAAHLLLMVNEKRQEALEGVDT